jgi:hypothetical protein
LTLRLVHCSSIFAAFALLAAEPSAARAHSTDAMDWLIQHVCADASDKAAPVDPYGGCPAGTHERRLNINEPMPYYRYDEGDRGHPLGFQRHDAYPVIDRHYGGVVSANDFDFDLFEPYGVMHPGDGDGYDVYRVANGWVTGGDTRDGGGYSSSFFGADCKPFGGWVLFPVSFLHALRPGAVGRTMAPIHGVYWEQAGIPWPGTCERGKGFSTTTLTTWAFSPGHEFGGLNGHKSKRIDAIAASHATALGSHSPLGRFHLERIYFTDLYGATRWEAWISNPEKPPNAATNCSGPTEMTYEGNVYTLVACRDWSYTEINNPPRTHLPWPYPEENILEDWHFTNGELSPWGLAGGAMTSELMNSRTESDTKLAPGGLAHAAGVRYLQLSCPGDSQDCGSLHQDIPIKNLPRANSYDYGFSGVVDDGGDGVIDVSLSQRDAQGRSLWEDHFTAHVTDHYRNRTVKDSVYKASSVFLKTAPAFALKPGAVALRLALSPRTAKRYDLVDAWVLPR